jgi:tRNA threonylcarbamoyladenosine biosynthesis protein TsaE
VRTCTRSAEETEDFAARLARARPEGDKDQTALAVIYLSGALGAGKTTFARGFVGGLGVAAPVRSPTYTRVELYEAGPLTLVHLDLYRLNSPSEIESLGLREWAGPGHLWLIEWPERAVGLLPEADLKLEFSVGADGHEIDVTADSALGRSWLVQLTGTR